MNLFKCQVCGQLLFFENTLCERCGHRLGYVAESGELSALEPRGDDHWQAAAFPGRRFRFCDNAGFGVCNWLVDADREDRLCLACRHNRTIPRLIEGENLARWGRLEAAKHRLIRTLLRLGLRPATRTEDPDHGLAFDFLADPPAESAVRIMTGHDNGVITLALSEADDAEREARRQQMGETYRTLLGHFRHETGHYYWDRLVERGNRLEDFRNWFGDERADYAEALKAYYANGPRADWQAGFVTAYASAHPWEDFAETWAHYLHIVDTLETGVAFGLQLHPGLDRTGALHTALDFDPHEAESVEPLIDAWLPLTFAVNSLNRSMGHPDLYPFVLSPGAIAKLAAVQALVSGARSQRGAG